MAAGTFIVCIPKPNSLKIEWWAIVTPDRASTVEIFANGDAGPASRPGRFLASSQAFPVVSLTIDDPVTIGSVLDRLIHGAKFRSFAKEPQRQLRPKSESDLLTCCCHVRAGTHGALGFVKLEQPSYHLANGLRDRGEANMAQHDPSSLTSAPVILHCGGTVLSAAIPPALSSYPKIETERQPR
jgi:hypothetical protein